MSESRQDSSAPGPPLVQLQGKNLVVVSPENIIEACFAVPAVRALLNAHPTALLAVLTPESFAPLWATVGGIKKLIEYPDGASPKEIAKLVKTCGLRLESGLAWEASDAARSLAKAGVAQRIGYDLKGLTKTLTNKIPVLATPGPVEHRVRRYLALIESLGIDCYTPQSFATPPLPPRPHLPRIGIVPGSVLGPAYRWNIDCFREVAEGLQDSYRAELVILAYPDRTNEANELDNRINKVTERARNFANEFNLAQLLAALPHCTVVISNDGAVTHLAAHLGVPTIALFGPGDPAATRPLGRIHTVLSQHVECSPCLQTNCPLDHHRCMTELTVSRVTEAAAIYCQPQAELQPATPS